MISKWGLFTNKLLYFYLFVYGAKHGKVELALWGHGSLELSDGSSQKKLVCFPIHPPGQVNGNKAMRRAAEPTEDKERNKQRAPGQSGGQ